MENEGPRCDKCKWYRRNKEVNTFRGCCRRFPPAACILGNVWAMDFPSVEDDDFCGEFTPKEPTWTHDWTTGELTCGAVVRVGGIEVNEVTRCVEGEDGIVEFWDKIKRETIRGNVTVTMLDQ